MTSQGVRRGLTKVLSVSAGAVLFLSLFGEVFSPKRTWAEVWMILAQPVGLIILVIGQRLFGKDGLYTLKVYRED